MDTKKIGQFLRDLRREQNLTQEELGEKLGATNKTISRWETGTYMPPADILLAMSKLYGVSVNELLSGERLATADYQPKAEENIVTTLKSKSVISKRSKIILIVACLTVFAVFAVFGGILLRMLLSKPYQPQYDVITVTFNSNGGSEVESQEFTIFGPDSGYLAAMPTPTKAGYVVSGWYTVDDLQTPWDFENDLITQSMTLYAKWEEATDGLQYSSVLDETGKTCAYKVYGRNITTANIVVPSHYQGKPVIGVSGFDDSDIKSIILPESIKTIDRYAFSDCKSLTQITIPDSVSAIEVGVFRNCSALTKVVIGSGVTSIDNEAFYNCFSLVEVYNKSQLTIEKGSQNLGAVAQHALNVYTSVSGQSNLTFTDDGFAFYADKQATLLVKYLGNNTDVILPDKFNGGGYDINQYAFAYNNNIFKVTVPASVKNVGQYAFNQCKSLQQVSLPNSIVSIGEYAFEQCENLQSVDIPEKIVRIEFAAFSRCTNLENVSLPNGLQSIGGYAFSLCERLQAISFPDSLTSIEQSAFDWGHLKDLVIPKNVQEIGIHAFTANALQSITVDEDNMYYYSEGNCLIKKHPDGDYIILGCNNSVIPNNSNITGIASWSFGGCSELTSLYIPDNITVIGGLAFRHCDNLQSLAVSPTNPVYHSYENCIIETATNTLIYMFKNGVIPNDGSVSTIDSWVLTYDFANEVEITIPNSVTSIYKDAFRGSELGGRITIKYDGTVEQWQQIEIIERSVNVGGLPTFVKAVICTDGEISR